MGLSSSESRSALASHATSFAPRIVAGVAISLVLVWVGSGWFYQMTGEKRTIGLGEEPLWFPHEAARFAGQPEMPERFLSFHNGHASLFEYYHGPERKVYTDPRLEVTGPELFKRYRDLEDDLKSNTPGWQPNLDGLGRPVILVNHEYNWGVGATLLLSDHWRCVWFDPIAAVFVHDSAKEAVQQHAVNFAARHFRPELTAKPLGIPERMASAKALGKYAGAMPSHRVELIRPLVWLGLDDARRILRDRPASVVAWSMVGQIELCREPGGLPSPRYRLSYDPVVDLTVVRSTYALRHAMELGAGDFTTLLSLSLSYENRLMIEAQLLIWDRILASFPINPLQRKVQDEIASKRNQYVEKLGTAPMMKWRNLNELGQVVEAMLADGRAESAAELLEQGYPPARAPWEVLDRLATLRLHLGEPARARALWQNAVSTPQSAVAMSRVGATYLAEEDFESAHGPIARHSRPSPTCSRRATAWPSLKGTRVTHRRPTNSRSRPSRRPRVSCLGKPLDVSPPGSSLSRQSHRLRKPNLGSLCPQPIRNRGRRTQTETLAARTGLARAAFQSLYSDFSSSTVTPPWSSPESQALHEDLEPVAKWSLGQKLAVEFLEHLEAGIGRRPRYRLGLLRRWGLLRGRIRRCGGLRLGLLGLVVTRLGRLGLRFLFRFVFAFISRLLCHRVDLGLTSDETNHSGRRTPWGRDGRTSLIGNSGY